MVEESPASQNGPGGVAGLVRAHPILCAIFAGCTLLGAGFGAVYLPGEWSLARRLAAGAFAGVGTGLLFTFTKVYGQGE